MKRFFVYMLLLVLPTYLVGCGSDDSPSQAIETQIPIEKVVEEPVEEAIFESDEVLNDFFITYNEIAEYPFEQTEIRKGNIRTKAIVSAHDLFMEIVNSEDGLNSGKGDISIKITDREELNDSLFAVFRDFVLSGNSEISLAEIETAWEEIQNKWYEIDYNKTGYLEVYEVGGIQMQFIKSVNYNEYKVNLLIPYNY